MEFGVLGQLRVRGPLGPLHLPSAKERVLLAHLIARAGQVVTADELIDSLWDGSPPRTASKSLQNYVLRLRNTLEPDRAGSPAVLVTDGPGYRLSVADDAIDARRFVRLVELGRRAYRDGRVEASAATLKEALALWYGPAYAGFESTGFGGGESRRLEELRLSAIEDRIAADVDLGRARDTVPELEALVHDHPVRERLWFLLVHALYRSGRQADALATYARARDVLVEELGVDPGDELQELYARVLAHDQTLLARVAVPVVPDSLLPAPGPFVGREQELARLRDAWELARAGSSPLVVVIRGPRGAGARRLAGELALAVAEQGGRVVHHTQRAPTAAEGEEDPILTVLTGDAAMQATATGSWGLGLTVLVRGSSAPVPPASEVIDLAPLTSADVRILLASYIDDDAAVDAALAQVEQESRGLPGRVHDAALRVARRRAAVLVDEAAARTGRMHEALDEARDDLRDGVSAYREVLERQTPAEPGQCPWKGLASYQVVDSPWFAGRERFVAELVARLSSTSLLAVVGASGSGKSSLVQAGLLAALESGALPGSEGWTRLVMRPGPHPMRELVRVALRGADIGRDRVAKALEQMVYGNGDAARAVLVVDQLEETWTSCGAPEEREAFLDALSEIANSDTGCTVVLVLRADYVGRLADRPGLVRALADATVLVGAPTEPELRRAVEHPAQRAGLHLDIGLADALVADAAGGPGLLPLLSTALTELWGHRDGRRLTLAAYATAGGIRGAVARLAERAFGLLDPPDQAAARVLLLRLAGPGEGAGVTRRRVPLADLAALPDPRVRAVVESLADARLLSLDAGHVEVAHEALFREWPRLRGWLEEDVAARAVQRRLVDAATDWDTGGREPSEVWRGTRLAAGTDFANGHPDEVTSVERAFLEAGEAQQDADRRAAEERAAVATRQNRRLRWLIGGLGLVLVTALVSGVLAWQQRQDAVMSAQRAEDRARAATLGLVTAAGEARGEDWTRSLLLAVEARRLDDSARTQEALLATLSNPSPIPTELVVGDTSQLALAVDPDSGAIVAKDADGVLTVLTPDGSVQHAGIATPPSFHRGGLAVARGLLVSSGVAEDGAGVVVHDIGDGSRIAMLDTEPGEVPDVAFHPDGSEFAVTGDGRVRIVDAASLQVVRSLRHPDPVPLIAAHWAADGTRVYAGGGDGEVAAWGLEDASEEPVATTVAADVSTPIVDLDQMAEGQLLVAATFDAGTLLLHPDDLRVVAGPLGADNAVLGVSVDETGSELAVAATTRVDRWQVFPGRAPVALEPVGRGATVAYTGLDTLVTGGLDGAVTAWQLRPEVPGLTSLDELGVGNARLDPTGRVLAMWGFGAGVRLFDSESLQPIATLPFDDPEHTSFSGVAFNSDGSRIAAVWCAGPASIFDEPCDGWVGVYDAATGEPVTDPAQTGQLAPWVGSAIAWSADDTWLATGHIDGSVEVRHAGDLRLETTLTDLVGGGDGFVTEVDFTDDAAPAPLLVATTGTDAATWSVPDWDRLGRTRVGVTAHFTPDGRVLTSDQDGTVRLRDAELSVLDTYRGLPWPVIRPRFSLDGARFVSIDDFTGETRIWRTDPLAPIGGPVAGRASGATISPDGTRVVVGSDRAWELRLDPGQWEEQACAAAGRNLTREEWTTHLGGEPYRRTCPDFPAGA